MVLDDDVEMVVDNDVIGKREAEFEAIFILYLLSLQVLEDCGGRQIVSQPGMEGGGREGGKDRRKQRKQKREKKRGNDRGEMAVKTKREM